ncbi:MAG: sensor histidine kinase, partial [Steroidobacteraceae bacterium]
LVDNALHYTPALGHITVRCGSDSGRPYLEVEDNGPGIPATERTRVRERFYRLPGSAGHGCGLGLAIVDEISRLHDADLAIDAGANGRGTRIKVSFRVRRAIAAPGAKPAASRPGELRNETNLTQAASAGCLELRTASQSGGV